MHVHVAEIPYRNICAKNGLKVPKTQKWLKMAELTSCGTSGSKVISRCSAGLATIHSLTIRIREIMIDVAVPGDSNIRVRPGNTRR